VRSDGARGPRCYWSPTFGDLGILQLVTSGTTVMAEGVTLEQACALVAPNFVTVGEPPARIAGTDAA
jgi:hypothetical protein